MRLAPLLGPGPWAAPAAPRARNECHNRLMRFFNTEGPVRPDDHYAISPLDRMDVDELLALIRAKRYFALHAPRQTGKTSALIALRDLLNRGEAGSFRCVDVNVEVGQVARDDVAEGMRAILSSLALSARLLGDGSLEEVWPDVLAKAGAHNALREVLAHRCASPATAGNGSAAASAGRRPWRCGCGPRRTRAARTSPRERSRARPRLGGR